MKRYLLLAAGALLAVIAAWEVHAAGLFNGYPAVGQASYCAGNVTAGAPGTASVCAGTTVPAGPALTGLEQVPADTAVPGASTSVAPNTVLVPSSMVAGATWGVPRNFLGNGALNVTNTNGTSTVTCATTSAPTTAALSADRWACDANVTSGAGRTAIVTSSPSPPTGFTNVMKVFRTSGALTQPVCVWSAIPASRSLQLAGQTVTFSVYAAALAGLSADNGNVINMVVISGTGTDQGLNGAWTASPAITPAWTGIATAVNTAQTVTTTFARYSTTAAIPAAATEVGVALCFTPTATGAGATDGFAWTGAQLEKAPGATLFETQSLSSEQLDAQTYFYKISEGAVGSVRAVGFSSTTSLAEGLLQFPVTMYKAPTMGYTAGFAACTTTACSANQACTAIRTSTLQAFAADANRVMIECTSTAAFSAAGSPQIILDNGGTGVITAWTGL